MSFLEDTHNRINQTLAQAGLRVVMPEDWAPLDALAERLNSVAATNITPSNCVQTLDRSIPLRCDRLGSDRIRFDRAFAARLIERHQQVWMIDGRMKIDERYCPYDAAQVFVFVDDNAYEIIPLAHPSDWKRVAQQRLSNWPRCNLALNPKCDRSFEPGKEWIAVKRGELICVFVSCALCLKTMTDERETCVRSWVFDYIYDCAKGPWPDTVIRPITYDPRIDEPDGNSGCYESWPGLGYRNP